MEMVETAIILKYMNGVFIRTVFCVYNIFQLIFFYNIKSDLKPKVIILQTTYSLLVIV